MKSNKSFKLYKIYYDDVLVYLGRTSQVLQNRMRAHMFKRPMVKLVDINQVSKIEFADFDSEADMFLYEIYYINLYKPILNCDDKAHDDLSVSLPEVEFQEWKTPLWDKWVKEVNEKEASEKEKSRKKANADDKYRFKKAEIHKEYKAGNISHDEYLMKKRDIDDEYTDVLYDLGEIDNFERLKRKGCVQK